MNLKSIYTDKLCPQQPRYKCEGSHCAKFVSCMVEEIDSLYIIGGITSDDADNLDKELVKIAGYESLL